MGRREFLRNTLVAVTVGVAGCSGFGGSDDADQTYEASVADHLATAVGQLNKAALAVNEFQNQDSDSDSEEIRGGSGGSDGSSDTTPSGDSSENEGRTFDAAGPRTRIENARESISAAEEQASDGQQADVAAVRKYADGIEGTVDAVVDVTTAGDHLREARDIIDTDDGDGDSDDDGDIDTDAANSALTSATEASSQSQTAHESAATALEAADGDRLAQLDAEYEALNSGLETLLSYVVGVDALAVGYDVQVDGIDHLQTAQDQVDAEEFDAAGQSFGDAQTAFTDATAEFTDRQEQAAEELQDDLTEGDERSRSLDHLSAGYTSLLDSRDHILAAESVIDDETDDSARSKLTAGSEDASTASSRFADGASIRDEFDDEFGTAQDRATAMQALGDGYTSLLDARDHIEAAEADIGEGDSGPIQTSLDGASADARTADQTFASGEGLAEDLLGEELATGRSRATAMDSLAVGYGHLLDGWDRLEAGESAFLAENYGEAETALNDADQAGSRAETKFTEGDNADDEDLFAEEFDRAFSRASVLRSLSQGYALIVQGRQEAEAGRQELDNENFDAAVSQFQTAKNTLDDAEAEFDAAQAEAGEQFASKVDRALCQVGHLQSAVDHFVAAGEAGRNRDPGTLQSERTAAEADLDRVDEC